MGPSSSSSSSSSSLIGSYAAFFFMVMLFIGSSDKMVGAEAPSGCVSGGTHGECTNSGEGVLCYTLCRALPGGQFVGGQCSDGLCVCTTC